jgi:anti-sigma regulatory factor (Ser/Thr protein kinase)
MEQGGELVAKQECAVPLELQEARRLRDWIAQAGAQDQPEWAQTLIQAVQLCLTELLTNLIVHGGRQGEASISLARQAQAICVQVRCAGHSFRSLAEFEQARQASCAVLEQADADPLALSGRGMGLICAATRSFSYQQLLDDGEAVDIYELVFAPEEPPPTP